MNLDEFKKNIDFNAKPVNQYLKKILIGEPAKLYKASSKYIETGGKRLRPLMVIKSCEMLGGSLNDAIPGAASVELIHNFSLVHDDIMDNDDFRHSTSTIHKEYGIPVAILAGDILFSKAFQILTSNADENPNLNKKSILDMIIRLSSACVKVCEGQALDVSFADNKEFPSEEKYIDMINKKTAALFEVSCAIGALSSPKSDDKDVTNLAAFGKHVGIAFQLIDDLIGVIGDPLITGKAVGNDIREGKKTYPILLALKKSNRIEKDEILHFFGNKKSTDIELKNVVKILLSLDIEKEVRDKASYHMNKAIEHINKYENNYSKQTLLDIAKFIVLRST